KIQKEEKTGLQLESGLAAFDRLQARSRREARFGHSRWGLRLRGGRRLGPVVHPVPQASARFAARRALDLCPRQPRNLRAPWAGLLLSTGSALHQRLSE